MTFVEKFVRKTLMKLTPGRLKAAHKALVKLTPLMMVETIFDLVEVFFD